MNLNGLFCHFLGAPRVDTHFFPVYNRAIHCTSFVGASFARDERSRFGDRSYNLLDASLRKS